MSEAFVAAGFGRCQDHVPLIDVIVVRASVMTRCCNVLRGIRMMITVLPVLHALVPWVRVR
jgi:hypothetical protein